MRRLLLSIALAVLSLAPAAAGDKAGTKVTIDGMSSTTPAAWVKQKPASTLRVAQFQVPRAKGDEMDADLGVFKAGGTVKQNVDRWKAQFAAPRGKSIDDVTSMKEIKIGDHKATYVDIQGTYKAPPFDPVFKGKTLENFRLLAVQFDGPDNTYQIRMTGPAKTVEANKKAFDDWLAGFKK